MLLFNVGGIVGAVVTLLLALGIYQFVSRGLEYFALIWAALAGVFAVLYDRLHPAEGFSAYWAWVNMAPIHSRIAGFGAPLLFIPLVTLVFAWIIPTVDGDPIPSAEFFVILFLIGVVVIVSGVIRHKALHPRPPEGM